MPGMGNVVSLGFGIDELNFADKAESVITGADIGGTGDAQLSTAFRGLTTTKIRGLYALITNVYTKMKTSNDFDSYRTDLQYLKVKMAYEAGRDNSVKSFLAQSHLRELVDGVKNYDQFILYCHYAESLVAYFKFYGGRD